MKTTTNYLITSPLNGIGITCAKGTNGVILNPHIINLWSQPSKSLISTLQSFVTYLYILRIQSPSWFICKPLSISTSICTPSSIYELFHNKKHDQILPSFNSHNLLFNTTCLRRFQIKRQVYEFEKSIFKKVQKCHFQVA